MSALVNVFEEPSRGISSSEMETGSAQSVKPIVSKNKLELARLIVSWITENKGTKPPACVNWDQKSFENCFAKEATCTNSSRPVWVLRLGILDRYMSWIVEYENGSCQLVRQVYNRRAGYTYKPWLGGDHGFAAQPIVCLPKLSGSLRIQSYAEQRGLDAEDVLNDYTITDLDSVSDEDDDRTVSETERLQEPQPLSPPLSSPLDSSSDGDYAPKTKRIRRSAQFKIGRNRGVGNKSRKVRTQADRSLTPQATDMTMVKNEDPQTPVACTDSTFNASGLYTLGPALVSPPDAAKNVRFHFFVANESLGAIMKTMDLHISRAEFFSQVTKAYQFGVKTKPCDRMIAASVSVEGWVRPIVVPRQSEEAFTHMMEVVRELASASNTGRLDVEVRCMRV
ncbi:MAG: hypothetical protein Q9214_002850 [Letrouitia sp. 1 TL-2023]